MREKTGREGWQVAGIGRERQGGVGQEAGGGLTAPGVACSAGKSNREVCPEKSLSLSVTCLGWERHRAGWYVGISSSPIMESPGGKRGEEAE